MSRCFDRRYRRRHGSITRKISSAVFAVMMVVLFACVIDDNLRAVSAKVLRRRRDVLTNGNPIETALDTSSDASKATDDAEETLEDVKEDLEDANDAVDAVSESNDVEALEDKYANAKNALEDAKEAEDSSKTEVEVKKVEVLSSQTETRSTMHDETESLSVIATQTQVESEKKNAEAAEAKNAATDAEDEAKSESEKAEAAEKEAAEARESAEDAVQAAKDMSEEAETKQEDAEAASKEEDEAKEKAEAAEEKESKLKEDQERANLDENGNPLLTKEIALSSVHVSDVSTPSDKQAKTVVVKGQALLSSGVGKEEEREFRVEVEADPASGFFDFSIDALPQSPENVAASFVVEVVRYVGQQIWDVSDADEHVVNFSCETRVWTDAMKILQRWVKEETSIQTRKDQPEDGGIDATVADKNADRIVFDGDVGVKASVSKDKRAHASIRSMNGDIDFDKGATSDVNFEVNVQCKNFVRHGACDEGSGRSNASGECNRCEDGFVSAVGRQCEACGEGSKGSSEDRTSCSCEPGYENSNDMTCEKCDVTKRRFSADGKKCYYCAEERGDVADDGSKCQCKAGLANDAEGRCQWSEDASDSRDAGDVADGNAEADENGGDEKADKSSGNDADGRDDGNVGSDETDGAGADEVDRPDDGSDRASSTPSAESNKPPNSSDLPGGMTAEDAANMSEEDIKDKMKGAAPPSPGDGEGGPGKST